MNDYIDPRPNPTREREYGDRCREMNETETGYIGPILAVVVLMLVGAFLFSKLGQ